MNDKVTKDDGAMQTSKDNRTEEEQRMNKEEREGKIKRAKHNINKNQSELSRIEEVQGQLAAARSLHHALHVGRMKDGWVRGSRGHPLGQ